jgi:hypothetical protein
MTNKKKATFTMLDVADDNEETPGTTEAKKTMKIKAVDFKGKVKPGTTATLYGINFTAMKNGDLVGEASTAVALAGIDAGLYKRA